jgi:hypothetical protein
MTAMAASCRQLIPDRRFDSDGPLQGPRHHPRMIVLAVLMPRAAPAHA